MTKRRNRQKNTIPSITLHKATGQARVRLCGRDFYLGPFGSDEAQEQYHRIVGEWLARGRKPPNQPKRKPRRAPTAEGSDTGADELTIRELVDQYQAWGEARYTRSTQAITNYYASLPMVDCYGSLPVDQFSPNKLRAVRQLMIQKGWCRTSINKRVSLIRSVFAWAASREMLPETVHRALSLVEPLRYGCGVRESSKKELVDDYTIEAIRPHISRQVYAIIKLMLLSGCRCGEVCQLRPMDISEVETDGVRIIEFRPQHHKTEYCGMEKVVRFGPVGMMILQPFLSRADNEYCFSPAEAEIERRDKAHEARVTPPSHGNSVGSNRKPRPQRRPGNRYETSTVRRAIERAVSAYNKVHADDDSFEQIKRFSPHQLRHSALTRIRDQFGVECAAAMGGHHSMDMVQLYTERSNAAARRVAAEAG